VVYYVLDPRLPRIDDYPGFPERGYDCFALTGKYFDIETKSMKPCTLREVMDEPTHPAHYSRRSLVFMGETRDGKTVLAKLLARRWAFMHQRDVPEGERKFVVMRGVEPLKSEAIREHLLPQVPIVFDDLMPGKAMHPSAEPTSFLKNLFEPVPGELHCRYVSAVLAAGGRIFTTNESEVDRWLALRGEHGEITKARKDAVLARVAFFRTQGRLYSANQAQESASSTDGEHILAKAASAAGRKHGI
jgi:hypothetical protein